MASATILASVPRDRLPTVQTMFAISGIIGAALPISAIIAAARLRADLDYLRQYGNELGAGSGPESVVFNAGLVLSGLLTIPFSFALYHVIGAGTGSARGPLLPAVGGAGGIGAGIFHCDPGCYPVLSYSGILHTAFGLIAFMLRPIATVAIARRLREDSRWENYASFSRLTGIVALIAFPLTGIFGTIGQLIHGGIVSLWMVIMALRPLRLPATPPAEA